MFEVNVWPLIIIRSFEPGLSTLGFAIHIQTNKTIEQKVYFYVTLFSQDSPRIKTRSKLIISFVNPLQHELTLGYFTVEAPGLIHPTKVNFKWDKITYRNLCSISGDEVRLKKKFFAVTCLFWLSLLFLFFSAIECKILSI